MYILVIKQLVIMLVIALTGYAFTKIFKFGKAEQQFISKLLIYFINPCLVLHHFDMDFDANKLKGFLFSFLLSCVVHLVMIIVGVFFVRSKTEEGKALDGLDRISVVFTNCAFIGIPLIHGVFPTGDGVFYLLGFIIAFNVLLWTVGYYLICGSVNLKNIVTNPNIIAVALGAVLFCFPIRLPFFFEQPLSMIGSMNSATAMILLGMLFATFTGFKKEYVVRIARLCVLRFIVCGICAFAVVFAAFKLFPTMQDIRLICYVVYIAALCPVGMTVSGMAVMFGKDESYSGLSVLVTSLLCVIMLPLGVCIAEKFF